MFGAARKDTFSMTRIQIKNSKVLLLIWRLLIHFSYCCHGNERSFGDYDAQIRLLLKRMCARKQVQPKRVERSSYVSTF